MKSTVLSKKEKFQSKKKQLKKKCKKAVKIFIEGYVEYFKFADTGFFSTWYGHPYGMR